MQGPYNGIVTVITKAPHHEDVWGVDVQLHVFLISSQDEVNTSDI